MLPGTYRMKGITTYSEGFSIWQAKIRDEMPSYDGGGNPILWFSKCLKCHDYVVCGLDTKQETLEYTRNHMVEYH